MDPLGSLIEAATPYGHGGLFALALLERAVPVIPSYGLFVAIGIGVSDGRWSMPGAVAASIGGSAAGCLVFYLAGRCLGETRALSLLRRSANLFGLSAARVDRLVAGFRRHQAGLSFGAQLVPTVRLMAPAVAGLLGAQPAAFLLASLGGLALWNGLFVAVGFAAAQLDAGGNASVLAITLLLALVTAEGVALLAWRRLRRPAAIVPHERPAS
jgi:membrane protein DedA with SNARE-associated domain